MEPDNPKPDCFGDLDKVFPLSGDGLREVPQGCSECGLKVECLRAALESEKGLQIRERQIRDAPLPEIVKRVQLWSLKKQAEREYKASSTLEFVDLRILTRVLFRPFEHFSGPLQKGPWDALAFGLLWGGLGGIMGYFYQVLLISLGLLGQENLIFGLPSGPGLILSMSLLIPVLVVLEIFLLTPIWHLALGLVGASKGGIRSTFVAVAMSQAGMIAGVIPILGGPLGQAWKFWIQMVAIRHLHQTSYGRILLAFIITVLAGLGILVAIIGVLFHSFFKGLIP